MWCQKIIYRWLRGNSTLWHSQRRAWGCWTGWIKPLYFYFSPVRSVPKLHDQARNEFRPSPGPSRPRSPGRNSGSVPRVHEGKPAGAEKSGRKCTRTSFASGPGTLRFLTTAFCVFLFYKSWCQCLTNLVCDIWPSWVYPPTPFQIFVDFFPWFRKPRISLCYRSTMYQLLEENFKPGYFLLVFLLERFFGAQ